MDFKRPRRRPKIAAKAEPKVAEPKTKDELLFIALEGNYKGEPDDYQGFSTFDQAAKFLSTCAFPIGIYKRVADVSKRLVINEVEEKA